MAKLSDPSLKPDPTRKGSYYRRIEDIGRALKTLGVPSLPPGPKFVGIVAARPAVRQYHHRNRLKLDDIERAAAAMKLAIRRDELEWIFADFNEQHLLTSGLAPASARQLRNDVTHDFGPTNAEKLVRSASVLIPVMERFLNCTSDVLAYVRTNFAHVP